MRGIDQVGLNSSEAGPLFAAMVEHVRDYAIFLITPDGRIASWNGSARRMKGFSESDVLGQHLRILYPPDAREAGMPERNLALAAEHGTYREEAWRVRRDGSRFWALTDIVALTDTEGNLSGFCKITADHTERRRLQRALQREKDTVEVTLRAIADGVISVDADGRIDLMNAQAETLTGWTETEARGMPLCDVLRPCLDATRAMDETAPAWLDGGLPFTADAPGMIESRDGTRYAIQGSAAPIPAVAGEREGGVVVFRDVTAFHAHVRRLAHEAAHDPLTGLVNRGEFERRLEHAVAQAAGGVSTGALLFLDLDGFKAVNDTAGHACGDRLLHQIGQNYQRHVRSRDTLARIGGDEFAVIIEHCTQDGARAVAEKLLRATRALELEFDGEALAVGVSVGIAIIDAQSGSANRILHAADQACYLAKSKGRDRVEMWERG